MCITASVPLEFLSKSNAHLRKNRKLIRNILFCQPGDSPATHVGGRIKTGQFRVELKPATFPFRCGALFCALDCDASEVGQPRDEVSVNHFSRARVVFANRAVEVCHEEGVASQRDSRGRLQPSDEAGVNRASCGSVVFANRAAVAVRHEEGVALDGESAGVAQPRDQAGVNHRSRGGVVFAHDPNGASNRSTGEIQLCAGVSWHSQKNGDCDKECLEGAQERPQI
jgi:hypothetical protein